LAFWTDRLMDREFAVTPAEPRFDEESLIASDPSGLLIEFVANDADPREQWTGAGVPAAAAIRGLHSVSLTVRDPEPTVRFMSEWLGYSVVRRSPDRVRVGVNGGGPGRQIDLLVDPNATTAVNGIGTVHHVAMAIGDEDSQLRLREELVRRAVQVTPVMDRQYFKSIYFREPNGVLFEVATVQPGFEIDEALSDLGRTLKLPPWEEQHRKDIERGLVPVCY
jgi:glyoxalase family protein